MKARLLAVLLTLGLPLLAPGEGAQPVLVSSSHSGAVTDLVFDAGRGLLISAGEDGTVRVWEAAGGRLKASLRISHRPVQRVAVHPRLPQVAVLVGENIKVDTLAVWDWEESRQLYSYSSPLQLLHLAYSPQGSYLAYSRADYESLRALDPQTGAVLPLLQKGFGIVSFFVVSKNENTIMGYQASGWITYWDVQRQEVLKQARTVTDLSAICITPSSRHILAAAGERLVAVDLLSGAVTAESRAAGIARLAVSPLGSEVSALIEGGAEALLRQWQFSGTWLIETRAVPASLSAPGEPRLTCLAYGQIGLFASDLAGGIYRIGSGGSREVFARNVHLPICGLAFRGDTLAAASEDGIFFYRSDFFMLPLGQDGEVGIRRWPNPLSGLIGVEFLDDRRLLVWKKGGETGALAVLDPASGEIRRPDVPFASPIQYVGLAERGVVVVEKGGLCRILDRDSFQPLFQYAAATMNKLVSTRGDILVGAANVVSAVGSPLLAINLRTGETVPVRDSSLFIYDLLYDRSASLLYSLAVEGSPQGSRTLLKVHAGAGFERGRVLASFDGEDLGAALAQDPNGRIYSSLGFGPVIMWDGSRQESLENRGRVARQLIVHGGKLFALNSDSSITVWEPGAESGQGWQIHLFRDGEWAAVSPAGSAYCSQGARKYLIQS